MKIKGKEYRALWFEDGAIKFIDQRKLPFKFEIFTAKTVDACAFAIKEMVVRGAPAIGAAAAYGMVLGKNNIGNTAKILRGTRPTAYDLFYAIDYMEKEIKKGKDALEVANNYVEDIISRCFKIGENGEKLIKNGMKILTHCNAGALATVDYGTALAPFRIAHKKGKKFLIYVDETRPRCQGLLTAWELKQEKIPFVFIVDNAAGYFMKNGDIDMVIVGADRIAKNGDFANKIGTYEKAVLAKENNIPFYVAAPVSTFDKTIKNGKEIIIEERKKKEITFINKCKIMPENFKVRNPAFDVTPAEYVTGYITEEKIIKKL
ncbi:MAG: S-methyl-5-thioribose-1-phosphate isomerase [Candidatus Thermoplasmatota archaeon]|jgi:translation initiation factor eIF-2B subunit alpha/methylthioribose-1-phosphate isomerase|nr:S-methyl-5-thioribose-1-phosphate isomerase [Candidatus Thermoplasmatota archaeon]